MRKITRRCLSVLMVCAVVGAGTFAFVNLDQGPEPVQQYGPVQDGEAVAPAIAGAIAIGIGAAQVADYLSDTNDVDPAEYEETQQIQAQIYSESLSLAENRELQSSSYDNWLTDARTIARMEGKNEFIRELENGSSQSQATYAAEQATQAHYARQQMDLIDSWNATIRSLDRFGNTIEQESNLSGQVLQVNEEGDRTNQWAGPVSITEAGGTITLANGSTVPYTTLYTEGVSGGSVTIEFNTESVSYGGGTYGNVQIHPPEDDNASPITLIDGWRYEDFQNMEDNASTVSTQVSDFASATYDQWSEGVVGTEDLVDPYLGAREFDPSQEGETWATRSLTGLGIIPPENMSSIERMTITDMDTGETVNGTLMAQADPPGADGYTIGETYNASQIDGEVFVATDQGARELDGNFRLDSVEGFDGESYSEGDTLEYSRPDYQAANLSAFAELSEQQQKIYAELQARERKIESESSDTGIGFPDLGSLPLGGAGIVVAVLALLGMAMVSRSN